MMDLAQIVKYCLLAVGLVLLLCAVLLLAGFLYRRRRSHSVITAHAHSVFSDAVALTSRGQEVAIFRQMAANTDF